MPDLQLRVTAALLEGEGVTSYELSSVDGTDLPAWSPGAHLDIHLPSGTVRQYSLCGDVSDRSRYRIAVLELPDGRGGSVEAHRELRPGMLVGTGLPRSQFSLVDAPRYVFVAGGIGITPLLPMIRAVHRDGLPWELVYAARSAAHFCFTDELSALSADRVRFVAEDADGRPDLSALATSAAGAAVFCCGPAGLMDALSLEMTAVGQADNLYTERFAAAPISDDSVSEGFVVELTQSAVTVQVSPDQTILEAVREAGVDAPSSCEMGICGTCETKVLSGRIDHRDELLTDDEKAGGATMMICVSRAACPRLVLDL